MNFCTFAPIQRISALDLKELLEKYKQDSRSLKLKEALQSDEQSRIQLSGLIGSSFSLLAATMVQELTELNLFVLPDKETAAYFANDFGLTVLGYIEVKSLYP